MCLSQDREFSRAASFADSGEILDGMVTRSRGEIRRVCSFKVASLSATPSKDFSTQLSGRFSDKVYSPRLSELKVEQSPQGGGGGRKGPFSPRSGEARASNLGKSG